VEAAGSERARARQGAGAGVRGQGAAGVRRWPAQGHGGVELLCVRESVAGEGGREREREREREVELD